MIRLLNTNQARPARASLVQVRMNWRNALSFRRLSLPPLVAFRCSAHLLLIEVLYQMLIIEFSRRALEWSFNLEGDGIFHVV